MPSGHTDRATINARRPLTDRMRLALASIARGERRAEMHGAPSLLNWGELSNPEKNAVRALRDRYSFATKERADTFRARLPLHGCSEIVE